MTKALAPIVAPYSACVAVDGPAGPLARVNADTPLTPASTLKLLTATAAIDQLGADHHFTTRVYTDSGNLVVVGAGDPLLATPEYIAFRHAYPRYRDAAYTPLADLADAIVAAGVHDVSGALLVTIPPRHACDTCPTWKPNYGVDGDVGSLGALGVDGGFSQSNGQVPAADPALVTGQRLAAMLATRGVTIAGGVAARRDHRPRTRARSRTSTHPPLSDIVGELLTSSDDYTAEELLRDLANDPHGTTPGNDRGGCARSSSRRMKRLGIPTVGLVMHDGSGLAPDRPRLVHDLARTHEGDEPTAVRGGRQGARGRRARAEHSRIVSSATHSPDELHAKTGSIDGVVGLVGLIDGPNDLHFAFLANGDFSTGNGRTPPGRGRDRRRVHARSAGAVRPGAAHREHPAQLRPVPCTVSRTTAKLLR